MSKVTLGPTTLMYPMPAVLVASDVNSKPTAMTAAWVGIVNSNPPMLSVGIRPERYTMIGIDQNKVFSINIPSVAQVEQVDYCGIVSGSKADKMEACGFNIFRGETGAPLIEQCPVNLECRMHHRLDLGCHLLVVAEIVQVHVSEECTTDGKPDAAKIDPLIYVVGQGKTYAGLGETVAKAFSPGRNLMK
ncbi:MAG: flavin reductase family protein [Desulfovibrio sp.]|uniref:flavin reductase family protein n=1 Tax=Desulfovibrio sp. 7SRBS1 TaxID=3378064 RepID=UPI003B3FF619